MPYKTIGLLFTCLTFSTTLSSEIYRWTDDKGHVHFGDQLKAPSIATAIELDLSRINISAELSVSSHMKSIFEENSKIRKQALVAKSTTHKQAELQKQNWCKKAQTHLQTIVGRVIFLDENNLPTKVSEKEREARAKKLSHDINARRCN